MNNLQKALARLIVLLRTMSPQSRMVAAVLLVLIVVSAAYLLNVGVSGDRVDLFGDTPVSASQLNLMRAAFAKAGLNDAEFAGDRIRVPRAQQSKYLSALADAEALPHNFGDAFRKMFTSNNPFISKQKQEQMLKFAIQKELSELISKFEGVESATVMYYDQTAAWPNQKRDVRACVTVLPKGNGTLTPELARKIADVVATPIGATPQDVTVVDSQGQGVSYSSATGQNVGALGHDLYAAAQHDYERAYKEKIQSALSFVPSAVVTVNVELHSEVEDSADSVKIDAKPSSDDRPGQGDRSHAPATLHGVRKLELGSANSPAAIDLSGDEGYETRHIKRAGLTPKRVTVSVAVPGEYYAQVWRERNGKSLQAEPTAEERAQIEQEIRTKIEQHVARVVPPQEANGSELASLVTVTAFPQMHKAEQPEINQSDLALAWLSEHSALVVAVVSCLLGLLILRSIVRSAARNAAAETMAARQESSDELNDLPRKAVPAPAVRRRNLQRPAMRDELRDLVRDDPGAAANVLRAWIGSAN